MSTCLAEIPTQVRVNSDSAKLDIGKRVTVSVLDPASGTFTALLVIEADDFSYRHEIELRPEAARILAERLAVDWL